MRWLLILLFSSVFSFGNPVKGVDEFDEPMEALGDQSGGLRAGAPVGAEQKAAPPVTCKKVITVELADGTFKVFSFYSDGTATVMWEQNGRHFIKNVLDAGPGTEIFLPKDCGNKDKWDSPDA